MSHETSLTQEELHMEALLGQLHPTVSPQSRDKLMFRAGRVSAGRVHLWQGVSSVFAMLLLCSLTLRTTPVAPEPAIMTLQSASNDWQLEPETPSPREMHAQAYINVRQRVLEQGLDALPDRQGGRDGAIEGMSYGEALNRYLAL